VDKGCLMVLGQETCRLMRSAGCLVPALTDGWVRSFRKRWKLSRIRRATTDRVDNPDLLRADNAWRREYEEVVQFPALWGITGRAQPIGPSMQFGADETPLPYLCAARGTYTPDDGGEEQQIRISHNNDKRQITGYPPPTCLPLLPPFRDTTQRKVWGNLSFPVHLAGTYVSL
jgi:hypothetical protein